ncbi:cyclic peptide export ABC transporter [Pyxidicoccus fallax]|uniref:Cyclic peptide export ABC transporter n=1 Tax=Pyxidicoccus fallax TaxID=394095 RepID=A0A848LI67_9BACT|nr:cyclic peptide export ABC transporter [Pyxidicoccus fallax]NMO17410.1 cyclic peptide export ABC transporter [Pyxidicoccus fallax]NPC77959.1 cyclic peptide export ABC transporter [Pyxidicoccus fallax]
MNVFSLLLRVSRGHFALAVVLGVISGACSARLISLINEALTREGPLERGLVLTFVGVGLLAMVTRGVTQMLLTRLNVGTLYQLRMRLSRRILEAPLRGLERVGSARVMSALQEDALAINQGLAHLPTVVISAATTLGCLMYLAWLSGRVFVGMVAVLVLGLSVYGLLQRRSRVFLQRARTQADLLFQHFDALTRGIKELKLHRRRRGAFLTEHLEPAAGAIRRLFTRSADLGMLGQSWAFLLHFSLIGLLLFAFPAWGEVDRRTLVGYTLVVLYLQAPLDTLLNLLHLLLRAGVAARHLEQMGLSLTEDGAEATPTEVPEPRAFQKLELVGVTHAYHREDEDRPFTLGPIDLTLVPGECVFLVGGNGSGKTTLAKLLTGLYWPESGELRVDGRVMTDADRDGYREYFSVVFSDFHLFEHLLGLGSTRLVARAEELLRRLRLERKVRIEGGRLSTTALSQGQRKRLALLTAYLEDRPIYVFDEWAADQDPVFKDVFYRELLPELKAAGKALVVISHDDRYFALADRVVRLESGRVVESTGMQQVS